MNKNLSPKLVLMLGYGSFLIGSIIGMIAVKTQGKIVFTVSMIFLLIGMLFIRTSIAGNNNE